MKDKKRMFFNALIFLTLFLVTYYIIFDNQNPKELLNNFKGLNYNFLIISFLMMLMYFVVEGINIRNILSTFNEKISIFKAIKFTFIGFFFSSITPATSGGQPMEVYYMSKENVKVSHGSLALILHMCGYQMSVVYLGIMCALLNPHIFDTKLVVLFIIGTLLNCVSLSIMLIGLFSEKLSNKIVNFVIKILKKFKVKNMEQKEEKIKNELITYHESAKYIKSHKLEFFKGIVTAFIQVVIVQSLPYFVYRSFGLNTFTFLEVLQMQIIVHCTVTSIPLPGSIGISETVFLLTYGTIFGEFLTNALIVHRGINFYLFVVISLFVVLFNKIYLIRNEKD